MTGSIVLTQIHQDPSAFQLAVRKGHRECVAYLESEGMNAESSAEVHRTPSILPCKDASLLLRSASAAGNEMEAQSLIRAGASLTSKNIDGWTALHLACKSGHVSMMELLIRCGAVLDDGDFIGRTPLMLAAEGGHDNCVRRLLSLGADISRRDEV